MFAKAFNFTPLGVLAYASVPIAGAVAFVLCQKLLLARLPRAAAYIAFIVSATVVMLGSLLSKMVLLPVVLAIALSVSTFLGVQWSHANPWSMAAVCRALASVAGLNAVFAALASGPEWVAVSLGIAGLLVYLANRDESP